MPENRSQDFVAAVEPKVAQRWYNANRYWNGEYEAASHASFLGNGGHATCHTIWVMMSPSRPIQALSTSMTLPGLSMALVSAPKTTETTHPGMPGVQVSFLRPGKATNA